MDTLHFQQISKHKNLISTYFFFNLILEVSVKTSQKPEGNNLALRCLSVHRIYFFFLVVNKLQQFLLQS